VATGVIGLLYHGMDLDTQAPFDYETVGVLLVRLLALVAGVFMLRGADWARWLALAWIAFHVVLSATHSWSETIIHALLLAGIACILLRPRVSAYFRGKTV
jgi:hypothetical protein